MQLHTLIFRKTIPPGARIRVLVVDDSVVIRRLVAHALSEDPAVEVVGAASNGAIALERIAQLNPDVITLDIEMPEMNGLDAARILTQLSPDTPILIVTLYVSKQLSDEARKVGARGACEKTDIGAVVDAVGALLRQETYFPN